MWDQTPERPTVNLSAQTVGAPPEEEEITGATCEPRGSNVRHTATLKGYDDSPVARSKPRCWAVQEPACRIGPGLLGNDFDAGGIVVMRRSFDLPLRWSPQAHKASLLPAGQDRSRSLGSELVADAV